jgi:orotate phosphoribosyltransferase
VKEAALLDLLEVRRGHFRYESGYHGEIWLDLDTLFLKPRALTPFVQELAARLARRDVEVVAGPLTGGAFLAQMIAAELGALFAYTEPQRSSSSDRLFPVLYRLPDAMARVLKGKRVAIVDDVVNAGSAIRGTFNALVEAGAVPTAVGALLTLSDAAGPFIRENGMALEHLATLASPLWAPADCPHCACDAPFGPFAGGASDEPTCPI